MIEKIQDASAVGIHRGLSYAQYEALPGINWSILRKFKRSAAHARAEMTQPSEPTATMDFGNAFHRFVLEREGFEREYVIVPGNAPGRRSNADKAWWAAFEEENKGRDRVTQAELLQMQRMEQGLYLNARIADVLAGQCLRELSIVWRDPEYGVLCKGRLDIVGRLGGATIVADLKTMEDASDYKMSTALDTFDWAGQLVWYADGLNTLRPMPAGATRVPYYFAVEKEDPYCARVLELGIASIEQGRASGREFLRRYVEATQKDSWPGYPDGVIELPKYAFREYAR